MKKTHFRLIVSILLFSILGLTGCSNLSETTSDDTTKNKNLDSLTKSGIYPKLFLDGIASQINTGAGSTIVTPVHVVNQYNLTYTTKDTQGNSTLASGILLIPSQNQNLDLIVYFHGTTTLDADAPTNMFVDLASLSKAQTTGQESDVVSQNLKLDYSPYLLLASEGKAVFIPDFLGFGVSSGLHPYMHANTLASVGIDGIKAVREFADSSSTYFTLSGTVNLTGYSEGGYAAMATHKELSDNSSEYPDITITKLIPGATPCNLSGSMMQIMLADNASYPGKAFLPYVVYAYNEAYNIESNANEFFTERFSDFETNFDGSKSITDISTIIVTTNNTPISGIAMVKSSFKDDLTALHNEYVNTNNQNTPPSGSGVAATSLEFYKKVIQNDLFNYNPGTTQVTMIYYENDDIIPSSNTNSAVARLQIHQPGTVSKVDPSGGAISNHSSSTALITYFATMKAQL